MPYSKEYFELESQFAFRVAAVEGIELEKALIEYTSFYKTFRIPGWNFDPNNEIWQKYLELIKDSDFIQTTYNFYLERFNQSENEDTSNRFGCFTYELDKDGKGISVHFRNTDTPEPGALSKERKVKRLSELREMFTEIRAKHPEIEYVYGWSWLYNIAAYTRLFPIEYIESAREIRNWFKSTALWGQFLDSSGNIKRDLADQFLNCISHKNTLDQLIDCFPYRVQELSAPIKIFYLAYGID